MLNPVSDLEFLGQLLTQLKKDIKQFPEIKSKVILTANIIMEAWPNSLKTLGQADRLARMSLLLSSFPITLLKSIAPFMKNVLNSYARTDPFFISEIRDPLMIESKSSVWHELKSSNQIQKNEIAYHFSFWGELLIKYQRLTLYQEHTDALTLYQRGLESGIIIDKERFEFFLDLSRGGELLSPLFYKVADTALVNYFYQNEHIQVGLIRWIQMVFNSTLYSDALGDYFVFLLTNRELVYWTKTQNWKQYEQIYPIMQNAIQSNTVSHSVVQKLFGVHASILFASENTKQELLVQVRAHFVNNGIHPQIHHLLPEIKLVPSLRTLLQIGRSKNSN